jgi:hypothetical protein
MQAGMNTEDSMLEKTTSRDETSHAPGLTRRVLLSRALSIAGVGAIGALSSHDALAANAPLASHDVYFLSVGGVGTPFDSLLDMQQTAPAATQMSMPKARLRSPMGLQPSGPAPAAQFRITMGWNPVKPVADWLVAAIAHAPTLQNGSLVITDASLNVRAFYNWSAGSISRIDLPVCDASSPAVASPILTIQAASLTQTNATGPLTGNWGVNARRGWRQQDFRVTSTAPIDAALTRTRSVSGITLAPNIRGGTFDISMGFGPDRPDLMGPFTHALQSGGLLLPDRTTDFTLHLFTPDLREVATVMLHDCRVLRMNTIPAATGATVTTVVTMGFAEASLVITPA